MNRGNQEGQTKEKENYTELLAKRIENNLKSLLHFICFGCVRGTEYAFDLAFSMFFPFFVLLMSQKCSYLMG